jgi:4-amino-4-deoxy-L-arabinose transferase-like glycosyltransferase
MWGMPASDSWESDGVAPRDFLVGIVKTYRTGDFFTYPPLHLLFLTVLTSPGWIIGLFKASSLTPSDLISEFIKIPYMTFFTVTARLLGLALSLGTIVFAGKIGQEIGGKRVGLLTVAICVLNPVLTYYGQTSNLDGPYLFWSTAAMWQWTRVISRQELDRIGLAFLFTVAAISTKDQAYAVFILSIPMAFALSFLADGAARENSRAILLSLLVWGMISLLLLLAIDGALSNFTGFSRRLAFLV